MEDMRAKKGLLLNSQGAVTKVESGTYAVKSQTGIGVYKVENKVKWECTCPDHIKREQDCKHIYATKYYIGIEQVTDAGVETTKIPLTYKQAWTAYNQAQKEEVRLFDALLKDLVGAIPEPVQVGAGRPRLSIRETLFCSIQKVYSQLSSRRAYSLFKNAIEKGQIAHAPHFNAPSKLLNNPDITSILRNLIHITAIPLASIEKDFAPDSTGFRTTSFGAYCEEKHGGKKEHKWLKAHIMSGIKTNIITDAIITDGDGADSPQFKPMVLNTAQSFDISEVSADKGYSSRENHDVVGEVGGTAYIPFKDNATGQAKGSPLWKKAFHFFKLHQEEFDEHYHKRSNVESTISAVKKKFGECLKSKNHVAQVNELLCKLIAYNITVLIHEMFENGINPDFLHLNSSPCTQITPKTSI